MILEISIALIAVAFVALVIYIILVLKALKVTLGQVNLTLLEARKQLSELSSETKRVIEHTNQITFDLKHKMEALNSVFNTVSNVGDMLEHRIVSFKKDVSASSFKENKLASSTTEHEHKVHELSKVAVANILELAVIGIRLWQKLKKGDKR